MSGNDLIDEHETAAELGMALERERQASFGVCEPVVPPASISHVNGLGGWYTPAEAAAYDGRVGPLYPRDWYLVLMAHGRVTEGGMVRTLGVSAPDR